MLADSRHACNRSAHATPQADAGTQPESITNRVPTSAPVWLARAVRKAKVPRRRVSIIHRPPGPRRVSCLLSSPEMCVVFTGLVAPELLCIVSPGLPSGECAPRRFHVGGGDCVPACSGFDPAAAAPRSHSRLDRVSASGRLRGVKGFAGSSPVSGFRSGVRAG